MIFIWKALSPPPSIASGSECQQVRAVPDCQIVASHVSASCFNTGGLMEKEGDI